MPEGSLASQIAWPRGIRTLQCEKGTGGHLLLRVDHWNKVAPDELARVQAIRSKPRRLVVSRAALPEGRDSKATSAGATVAVVLEALAREVGVQVIPREGTVDIGGVRSSQGPLVPRGGVLAVEGPVLHALPSARPGCSPGVVRVSEGVGVASVASYFQDLVRCPVGIVSPRQDDEFVVGPSEVDNSRGASTRLTSQVASVDCNSNINAVAKLGPSAGDHRTSFVIGDRWTPGEFRQLSGGSIGRPASQVLASSGRGQVVVSIGGVL